MTRDELVLEAHSRLRTLPFRYRGGTGPGANGRLHNFGDRVVIRRIHHEEFNERHGTDFESSTGSGVHFEIPVPWTEENDGLLILDTLADVVQWAKTNGLISDEYLIETEHGVWALHDGKLSRFYRWDLIDPDWLEAHMMGGS